jgi:hypothetical protein
MAKIKDDVNGLLQQFALVSDSLGEIFPKGKSVVVFSLDKEDFEYAKAQVNNLNRDNTQFKIDMSGIEFIFLRDELLTVSEDKSL